MSQLQSTVVADPVENQTRRHRIESGTISHIHPVLIGGDQKPAAWIYRECSRHEAQTWRILDARRLTGSRIEREHRYRVFSTGEHFTPIDSVCFVGAIADIDETTIGVDMDCAAMLTGCGSCGML